MKIGILSDIHCNLAGLDAALALLDDCEELICAGDLMYQFRFEAGVLQRLEQRRAHTILGNHDKTILHAPNHPLRTSARALAPHLLDALGAFPSDLTVETEGVRIRVFHGAPWDAVRQPVAHYLYPEDRGAMERLAGVAADVVVLGHTHVPYAHQTAGPLVVNPGSCGEPRPGGDLRYCAALDLTTRTVDFRPILLPALLL